MGNEMKLHDPPQNPTQQRIDTVKEQGKDISETEAIKIKRTLKVFAEILIEWFDKMPEEEKEKWKNIKR